MSNSPVASTFDPQASNQYASVSSPSQHDSSILSHDSSELITDTSSHDLSRDSEKHPKSRRKRTTAQDKSILEDAYNNNAKPDKQARLDIVSRVSLNEKEVQIWFQNRRQNDRRKSRPLSPQELAALRFNGLQGTPSDPNSPYSMHGFQHSSESVSQMQGYEQGHHVVHTTAQEHAHHHPAMPAGQGMQLSQPSLPATQSSDAPSSQGSQDGTPSMSQSFSSSVGYLANRWNLGNSFSSPIVPRDESEAHRLEAHEHNRRSSDRPSLARSQSQSHMRLALSLEGKAELVSNAASPTKEAPQRPSMMAPDATRPRGLKRSYSALPAVTLPPISALTSMLPARLHHGRSRDVNAWESCADSDKRDDLAAQAENESNGSAIAAISLLRSTSGVLQSSSTKRNAPVSSKQARFHPAKKAKLSRTMSSIARLEHTGKENDSQIEKPTDKLKVSRLLSPTDSDKENLSPDEDGNPRDEGIRRPLLPPPGAKSQNPRRVGRALQDRGSSGLLNSRANTAPSRRTKGDISIFDDSEKPSPRANDVEKFMRGEVSPSKKGDMDCIAGLLSLSQGAWR